MTNDFRWRLIILFSISYFFGCNGDGADNADGGPMETESDADTDSDTDTDNDVDTDGDTDTDSDSDSSIDDEKYQWHTFYGNNENFGSALTVDSEGNIYVVGGSHSTWEGPDGQDPLQQQHARGLSIFVLKLDSSGTYKWHEFFGGSDLDAAYSVAVDIDDNIYLAGQSQFWLGPNGEAPLHECVSTSVSDAFVLKLDSEGSYQWHTFYGSDEDEDWAASVVVDAAGDVVVSGSSLASWNGPDNESALKDHSGGEGCMYYFCSDMFALKLNGDGEYQWHAFYGAAGSDDYCHSSAVDSEGNVYLTGLSPATWEGPDEHSPLHPNAGDDVAVLGLAGNGEYRWHTFYGSQDYDGGYSIAVDKEDRISIVGRSGQTLIDPVGNESLNSKYDGNGVFVLSLDSDGEHLWHTIFIEDSAAAGTAHAVDEDGNIYITGSGSCWNDAVGEGDCGSEAEDNKDVFVLKLGPSGDLEWRLFYGGADFDESYSIVAAGQGRLYLTGYSYEAWNGPNDQVPLHQFSSQRNIFVLSLMDQ